MEIIFKGNFKKLEHIEEKTGKNEKGEPYQIAEHYNLVVDDENMEARILNVETTNEDTIEKLKRLKSYTDIYVLAEVYFFNNKPSKIVVIDVFEEVDEIETTKQVLNEYLKKVKKQ